MSEQQREPRPQVSVTQQGGSPDGRGEVRMAPEGEVRSYYGRAVLKEPVWSWEIPWYFFAGGLAGAWVLSAFGSTTGIAAAHDLLGLFPRLGRFAEAASALLGLPLATYTAVLIADTSVPVWHEARRELPLVFAASSAA